MRGFFEGRGALSPLIAVLDSNVYLDIMGTTPLQDEPAIQYLIEEAKRREVHLHWESAHLELTLDGPKSNLCPRRLHSRLGLPAPRIDIETALDACQRQFDSHIVNAAILCKVYSLFDQQGRRPAKSPHYLEELIRWASLELGISIGCLLPLLACWSTGAGWYDGLFKYTKSLNRRTFPDRTRCAVNGALDLHFLTTWHSLAQAHPTADVVFLTGDRGLGCLVPKFSNVTIQQVAADSLIEFSLELETERHKNLINRLCGLDYSALSAVVLPATERIRRARVVLTQFRNSDRFQFAGELPAHLNC